MTRAELNGLSNNIIREETKKILNIYDTFGIKSNEAIEQEKKVMKEFFNGYTFIQLARQISEENR